MKEIKFTGKLSDLKKIIEKLIEKYPNNITLYEIIIKKYGEENVILC